MRKMNDPHVAALIYRVEHGETVAYDEAAPLVREEQAFRLEVEDKRVRFVLKDHYATEAEARKVIEEYIHIWEFDACLDRGPDFFRLRFHTAEIEDRNPPPPTPGVADVSMTATAGRPTVSMKLTVVPPNYPTPPANVSLAPNIETMYQRYMGYCRGREPLASMAYFCLTVLEHSTGKKKGTRPAAGKKYQIGKQVLDRIGELSAEKGGSEARKADGVATELTESERRFLKEAIRRMIRRAAEKAYDPHKSLPEILLSDLPQA